MSIFGGVERVTVYAACVTGALQRLYIAAAEREPRDVIPDVQRHGRPGGGPAQRPGHRYDDVRQSTDRTLDARQRGADSRGVGVIQQHVGGRVVRAGEMRR